MLGSSADIILRVIGIHKCMYVHIYYIAQAYRVYCGGTVVVTCTIPSYMHGSGGKITRLVLHMHMRYIVRC